MHAHNRLRTVGLFLFSGIGMFRFTCACGLLCLVAASSLHAQHQHADTLTALPSDTLFLRKDNLVPFTEKLRGSTGLLRADQYYIDYFRGCIVLQDSSLRGQRIVAGYAQFDYARPYRMYNLRAVPRPDSTRPLTLQEMERMYRYRRPADSARADGIDLSRLQYSGSISRAVTVGTDRDLAVNSDFRLQLNGNLGNDLEISAALSDENIPIQPSGTTQQITDFDRIFIQLRKGRYFTTFGDMNLQTKGMRFGNIFRNVQGIMFGYQADKHRFHVSGTISKGRFNTNSFQGENGRQGPYRLTGRENERFIIILAGSERVYINGTQVTRGEDRDYVIEYNTGEITFTPSRVIDVNARIVIDFQYRVQNYARTLVYGEYQGKLLKDKLDLRISYGREADDPSVTFDQPLGTRDLAALRSAGPEATQASSSGVDSLGYTTAETRYEKRDTTVGATLYQGVLVQSTNPALAVFRATFSFVGPGRGDYVRAASNTNSNVFKWVPPLPGGIPAGDFAPVRILAAPRATQVANLGAAYAITPHVSVFTESAISGDTPNLLSASAKAFTGVATHSGLRLTDLPLGTALRLSSEVAYQYVDARYTNFDRVYKMEYGRDWNFDDLGGRALERLAEASLELKVRNLYRIKTTVGLRTFGLYADGDSLRTRKLTFEVESTDSTVLQGKHTVTLLTTEDRPLGNVNTWVRHNGDVFRSMGRRARPLFQIGTEIWLEDRRNVLAGDVADGTFSFADLKPYVRSAPGRKLEYNLAFNYRSDREYLLGQVRDKALTYKPSLTIAFRPTARFSIQNKATYFRYILLDTTFRQRGLTDQQTFLNNFQVNYSSKNRFWGTQGLYEVSTEQANRRQVTFVRVNAGLGQYEWLDYNNDGMQQLNEFELASNPLLANYVRILLPTGQLIPAIRLTLGLTFRFDFSRLIQPTDHFFKHILRNISTVTNLRLEQRRTDATDNLGSYFIRLARPALTDTNLLSSSLSIRHDMFFFRGNPIGDFSFGFLQTENRQFLASGNEERYLQSYILRQRLNLSTQHTLENVLQAGVRQSRAEAFSSRNFSIVFYQINPSISFQYNRKLRLTGGYEFKYKRNALNEAPETNARLVTHKLIFDGRLAWGTKNNLLSKLEVLDNQLSGNAGTSAQFELLEGLRAGRNVVWNLLFTQYLSKILEFSLIYDLRSAQSQPTLHSTRIQLKAIF